MNKKWTQEQFEEIQGIADSVIQCVKLEGEWENLNECIDNMVHGVLTCKSDTLLYDSEYNEDLEDLVCESVEYLVNKKNRGNYEDINS